MKAPIKDTQVPPPPGMDAIGIRGQNRSVSGRGASTSVRDG